MRSKASTLSTDPPYYDNIGYADLSDYFYIWMRQCIRDIYPDMFGTLLVPKADELIASTHRHGGKREAKNFFEKGMLKTFTNLRQNVMSAYPTTVYYAFKQQDAGFLRSEYGPNVSSTGWETMLESMLESGFSVSSAHGLCGPKPALACGRKRATPSPHPSYSSAGREPDDAPATSRRRFLDALRAELPAAIAEMKTGSIAPVDMAQATIGPGMAIYSRYSAVRHADGNAMSVREALAEINRALDEVLEGAVADLDAETRFAIDWFTQYASHKGDFGDANTMAQGQEYRRRRRACWRAWPRRKAAKCG